MLYCCLKRTRYGSLSKPLLQFFGSKTPISSDRGQDNEAAADLPLARRIVPLEQFIKMRRETDPKFQLQTKPRQIFIYGVDPLKLKNYLFVYFKYGYWHQRIMGEQTLLSFIDTMSCQQLQITALLSENPNDSEALDRLSLLIAYQKQISTTLLPATISQMQICEPYIKILIKYLENSDRLDIIQLKYILVNFQNIMYNDDNDQEFISDRDYGWLMISAFDLLVKKLKGKFHELQTRDKTLLICFAKTLRSNNLPFLEFVKKEMQQEKKQINFNEFLVGLNLLAINRSFPYEYFYKNKEELMDLIEAADSLSQKKVKNSLALLQIFSRERLMYCEKIIDRLLECIQNNLVASNLQQLTRIFYYYSRLKGSVKHQFVIKLVERIYIFMDSLTERDYSLIVKALANLNYQDEHLVQKLKQFNYQLFLTNLKYGCEKLGSFYKAILDQIQNTYKNDSSRYERLEDQPFSEVKFIAVRDEKTKSENIQEEKQAVVI